MASCYNLNGRQSPFDGKTHVPCNMTAVEAGGHSTCCPIGDLCLTNGMCLNAGDKDKKNWYWRTACTDKDWKDPACPRFCESIEPTRNTGLIFNCLKKESWCCAYVGEKGFNGWSSRANVNTTCCAIDDLTFTTNDPVVYATATMPIQISVLSTVIDSTSTLFSSISQVTTGTEVSSRPTTDSDATAGGGPQQETSQQAGSSSGMSTGAKAGLGVGIAVGVLGLAAIGAFFWMRRRKRTSGNKDVSEMYVPAADDKSTAPPYQETSMNQHGAAVYRHEAPSPHIAAELPAGGPHELHHQTKSAP